MAVAVAVVMGVAVAVVVGVAVGLPLTRGQERERYLVGIVPERLDVFREILTRDNPADRNLGLVCWRYFIKRLGINLRGAVVFVENGG